MNFECELTCGHASRQHPQVMHREKRYANCCVSELMRGNFDIGSSVVVLGRLTASAVQACRTRPLMTMVHAPHTSSRQLAWNTGAETRLPWRVMGLRRISISIEMTLWSFLKGISNSCQ